MDGIRRRIMGMARIGALMVIGGTVLLAACTELVEPPRTDGAAATDSSVIKARIARYQRPGGPARVGGTVSDTMGFMVDVDSFRIELVNRSCAAPSNTVTVVSPTTSVLSGTMCQVAFNTVWSFPTAYDAGDGIVLDFESGVGVGEMKFAGAFPNWTVSFEDGADTDFNDFVLDVDAFPADTVPSLTLASDTLKLRPWIQEMSFGRAGLGGTTDTLWIQGDSVGDSTTVKISAFDGVAADTGATVVVRAELLPGPGGHAHQTDRLGFDSIPTLLYAAGGVAMPITGYFKVGSSRTDSLAIQTDSTGTAEFRFVAGFIGGRVDLIASATIGGEALVDTLKLEIRVPDLIDLTTRSTAISNALFVGAVPSHPYDSTWFVTTEFADAIEAVVAELSEGNKYVQLNDASLPFGGSFTVESQMDSIFGSSNTLESPRDSHLSHSQGVDIDMGECFAESPGAPDPEVGRVSPPCATGRRVVLDDLVTAAQSEDLIVVAEFRSQRHYHVRLRNTVTAGGGS